MARKPGKKQKENPAQGAPVKSEDEKETKAPGKCLITVSDHITYFLNRWLFHYLFFKPLVISLLIF